MNNKLKERVLVDYIRDFFQTNLKDKKTANAALSDGIKEDMQKK